MTTVDLADYQSGSSEPWTVDILLAIQHALRPQLTLELGSYEGMTTKALAENATRWGGRLITVELDPARQAVAQTRCAGLTNIEWVLADTEQYLRDYAGDRFGFVFVDDDHDKAHVARELNLLHDWQHWTLMAPGGVIACHDVVGAFGLGPVVTAHHGFVLNLPLLHPAGGLGLIQVPRNGTGIVNIDLQEVMVAQRDR